MGLGWAIAHLRMPRSRVMAWAKCTPPRPQIAPGVWRNMAGAGLMRPAEPRAGGPAQPLSASVSMVTVQAWHLSSSGWRQERFVLLSADPGWSLIVWRPGRGEGGGACKSPKSVPLGWPGTLSYTGGALGPLGGWMGSWAPADSSLRWAGPLWHAGLNAAQGGWRGQMG